MLMKNKGLNALEVVFTIFVLIVVVLVVVRMVTNVMQKQEAQKVVEDIRAAYGYTQQRDKCANICGQWQDTSATRDAVEYCLTRVQIDLNGNKKPGERGVGAYLPQAGSGVCEDGLYCFHIYDCCQGTYCLTPQECAKILCRYYMDDLGYSPEEAIRLIRSGPGGKRIYPGTCHVDYTIEGGVRITEKTWWEKAKYNSTSCNEVLGLSNEESSPGQGSQTQPETPPSPPPLPGGQGS